MMKKTSATTSKFPIGARDANRVSTTIFNPGAREITLFKRYIN